MSTYKELEYNILNWADEKGIFEKGNPLAQMNKTFEECHELEEALYFKNNQIHEFTNRKGKEVYTEDEIKDALGDILVTIIIQSEFHGLDLLSCLDSAYKVISKRKGVMVDGQFVKE